MGKKADPILCVWATKKTIRVLAIGFSGWTKKRENLPHQLKLDAAKETKPPTSDDDDSWCHIKWIGVTFRSFVSHGTHFTHWALAAKGRNFSSAFYRSCCEHCKQHLQILWPNNCKCPETFTFIPKLNLYPTWFKNKGTCAVSQIPRHVRRGAVDVTAFVRTGLHWRRRVCGLRR